MNFQIMPRVVLVVNLADFMTDVPLQPDDDQRPIVRLVVTEISLTGAMPPMRRIALNLQGVSPLGEIVWLNSSHRLWWTEQGPIDGRDKSIHAGYYTLHDLVSDWLTAQGYEVRRGCYGIPSDITPLNGSFSDCAYWKKVDEQTFEVVAAEPAKE